MNAWSEARARFADLDAQALEGLGRSDITVKKYRKPTGFMAVVFAAVLLTYIAFSRRSNFQPGSSLYNMLLGHVKGFARFCYRVQPLVLYPTLVIHLAESIHMHQSRLRKYNVPMFSRLWWTWIGSTMIEGVGAFIRIDQVVKEEEMKKGGAKH